MVSTHEDSGFEVYRLYRDLKLIYNNHCVHSEMFINIYSSRFLKTFRIRKKLWFM